MFKPDSEIKRGSYDLIANILLDMECSKDFQEKVSLCFRNYSESFDGINHEKLWVALKQTILPQRLTVLMHNLRCGQNMERQNAFL